MKHGHYFSLGANFASLVLLTYVYARTGSHLAGIFAGCNVLFGAQSLAAVRKKGVRV